MPVDILVIDAGSSAIRCFVVRDGQIAAVARRPLEYTVPADAAPFGREFDPNAAWSLVAEAAREAVVASGSRLQQVAGVAVAAQREALVFVDGAGRPLYGGPNVDLRAIGEGMAIDAARAAEVYEATGRLPSLLFAPARLAWFRNHRPAVIDQIGSVLSLAGWFAYRLTGERVMERALAGELGLLDVRRGDYARGLLAALDVPAGILPPLVGSGELIGGLASPPADVLNLAAGTPVFAAGPDTQCALVGAGVRLGGVGVVGGWSCPVMIPTASARIDQQRRTWTGLHVAPGQWVVESNALDAGRAWQWWVRLLVGERADALAEATALAEAAPAGAGGALALLGPRAMNAAQMGLRTGGLVLSTPLPPDPDRGALLRAALENVAFAVRANLEQAAGVAGQEPGDVTFGGGLSRSGVLCRILASVLARPVRRASPDSTALGAAACALVGLGLRSFGDGVAGLPVVEPDPNEAARYEGGYRRWLDLDRWLNEEVG